MKIIDCHTHPCFKDEEFRKIAKENKIDFSLNGLMKEMKANDIEKIVAISNFIKYNYDILKLKEINEKIAAVACIDIKRISKTLNELKEDLKERKFCGIKLYPGYQHFYPNESKCKPIYKFAEKYDIVVIFHSGNVLVTPSTKKAKVKYAHPIYIDDVAVEYPDMKIVIAHAGNPWIIDASVIAYKNPNVFVDISGWFLKEIDEREAKIMKEKLNFIATYAGLDKILFGTDWPLIKMRHYINFIKSMEFKNSDLKKIMYKNAYNLFWKS